jgi:phage nucleotide-binding protein
MPIKIKSTKEVSADGANIVIYGESGVGKTTLISHLSNSIILSADKGLLSISDFDIPYIEINDMQDVDDSYNYIKKNLDKYDHIIFDSLTEIAEVVLFEMKEGKKDKRQAYGELADAFGVMIRRFRDLSGINTIFLAKRKHIIDEDGQVIGFEPMMPGRVLPHGLPYLTDEVFAYVMDRKKERAFITSAERKYPAKDRSGRLDPLEKNPNLNDIINKLLKRGQ